MKSTNESRSYQRHCLAETRKKDIPLFYGRQWQLQAVHYSQSKQLYAIVTRIQPVNGAKSSWLTAVLLLSIYVMLCVNYSSKKILDSKFENHLQSWSFFRYMEQQWNTEHRWRRGKRRGSWTFIYQSTWNTPLAEKGHRW